jgi:hypothetical protein
MMDMSFDRRLAHWPVLEEQRLLADRLLEAWSWKSRLGPSFPLIGCLMGGTGTGKSTVFNSLAGRVISDVSNRRPSTTKPKILAHEAAVDGLMACPFLVVQSERDTPPPLWQEDIETHQDLAIFDLILVDTPDFDSAELGHHLIADNFFLISDLIILITSQEKYADMTAYQVSQKALEWGKKVIFVMNKVASDTAYDDFRQGLLARGFSEQPIRIERLNASPSLIPGLRNRVEFAGLFAAEDGQGNREHVRAREMDRLREKAECELGSFLDAIGKEQQRVAHVNSRIAASLQEVVQEMEERLDAVVSRETETHIRERLQGLLRKYDVLFVPRMMVRNALKKAFITVAEWLGGPAADFTGMTDEKTVRSNDLREIRAEARLEPLEAAIAKLNLKVAELLCSDSLTDDLCKVVHTDVPRWNREKMRALYDEAFPGVEQLLEREFQQLREGLSGTDELKLYGSYTLWALLLITVEITVLGGSALLDALLGTVLMPFIPKLVLNAKVVDLLRDIGLRVEREHRETLRDIVQRQAGLYTQTLSRMLPEQEKVRTLQETREKLQRLAQPR